MGIIEILGLAFIGIGAFVLQLKKDFRFVGFLNLLLAITTILFLKHFVNESAQEQLYALIAILGLNFVAAQIKFFQKAGIRVLIPLISFGAYFFIFKIESITILGEEYTTANKFVIAGILLSLLAFEFGAIKEFTLKKIFKGLETAEIVKSVMICFMAFSVFLGGFASASFGLLLVSSAFITSSFYRSDESKSYGVSFLTLSVLTALLSLTGETEVNLLGSDVLEGLFIGVFGAYFIGQLWEVTNRFVLFVGYFLLIGFSVGLLFLQKIYGQMGGMDAFIGIFIGTSVVNLIKGKEYVGQTIFSLLLIIGSVLPSTLNIKVEKLDEETEITEISEVIEEEIPPTILSLKELSGAYQLNPYNSKIDFYLGRKGETKGKFSNVSGEFIFEDNIENSSFSIELKMTNFTTFNSFRDQSLMGDDYFKVDNFPIMTFKGKKIIDLGNNQYEIEGKFMMLGVAKDLKVSLSGIEKDGKSILIGKGKIDRREFGMAPSATEGNIVSFEYEVELN